MSGDDLVHLASNLFVNGACGNAEARYRSAVSRAYYGAFHLVVAFLNDLGSMKELAGADLHVPANHTGHDSAYRMLFNTGVPEGVEAARTLNDLRSHRNRADYKLAAKGFDEKSAKNVKDKIEMAESVSSLIKKCRSNTKIQEFVEAIKGA